MKTNRGKFEDHIKQHFPSFLWIVRDFSLKMEDKHGVKITSREYLENALTEQKGVTDKIENKNRIRRLLKCFFHERDCFTLVRPVEDEKKLQNLNQLEPSEMRPQFVKQITKLNSKIFRKIKPKKMNGKFLDGELLLELCRSYERTINDGDVPNIDSAWSGLCKNETLKAFREAEDTLDRKLQELVNGVCLTKEQLKETKKNVIIHTQVIPPNLFQLKSEIYKNFTSRAFGDPSYIQEELKRVD